LHQKKETFLKRLVQDKTITISDYNFAKAEDWRLASKINSERKFPIVHNGAYQENLLNTQSAWGWLSNEVEKNLKPTESIVLSIDKTKQNEIFAKSLNKNAASKKNKFYIYKENGLLLAVLKVAPGQTLTDEDKNNLEEVESIPWKELKLKTHVNASN
jgi:hypothetical protein